MIEFPEDSEVYIGYLTLADGIGCTMGPLIGSLVYAFLNYVDTFYFFSVYILVIGLISVVFIPSRDNTTEQT